MPAHRSITLTTMAGDAFPAPPHGYPAPPRAASADPDARGWTPEGRADAIIAVFDADHYVESDVEPTLVRRNRMLEPGELVHPDFAAIDGLGVADGRIVPAELAAHLATLAPGRVAEVDALIRRLRNGRRSPSPDLGRTFVAIGAGVGAVVLSGLFGVAGMSSFGLVVGLVIGAAVGGGLGLLGASVAERRAAAREAASRRAAEGRLMKVL